MQIRGRRQCDARDVVQREVARETDDRVALVVQAAPSCSSSHLGVLRTREELSARVRVFRKSFECDRSGGHVHTEGESLGRKDHGEQVSLEARLDDLAKRGHHPGVVHRDPTTNCVDEVGVLEGLEIIV